MDVGTLEHGEPYLVIEYLHGAGLGTVQPADGARGRRLRDVGHREPSPKRTPSESCIAIVETPSRHRPRIELRHGTADTIINFNDQTEAIKEWTKVLGLNTDPTSNAAATFGGHRWTHQSWQDACGFTVLEAWSEQKGTPRHRCEFERDLVASEHEGHSRVAAASEAVGP